MLARRFALVCILLTLFGMWFSSLVAGLERPQTAYGANPLCALERHALCSPAEGLRALR